LDGNGRDVPAAPSARDAYTSGCHAGMQWKFHIGDKVKFGGCAGTITDVGTVLIQIITTEGRMRMACLWELVKTRDSTADPAE
jgi:hypothetical protein